MWYSKDDVLKDLAECTGGAFDDLDEDYIVRGSRPPPPPKMNEIVDDEFKLRFGGCGDHLAGGTGPDLAGITNMLRMVDTFDRPQETYTSSSTTRISPRIKEAPKDTIVISKPVKTSCKTESPKSKKAENKTIIHSKLNPDVSEFVPRSLKPEKTNGHIGVEGNEITSRVMEPKTAVVETSNYDAINKNSIANTSEGNKEESEKQRMVALLKSKISASGKENTVEKKREKNVALAALLRLNSGLATPTNTTSSSSTPKCPSPILEASKLQKSDSNNPEKAAPLVLFTPDYFAGPICSPKVVNVDDSEHSIPEPKPPLETPLKTPSPQQLNDPQMKESINKVNSWLNSPQKPKANAVSPHIGPVTFKKKESSSSKSPSSSVVSKKAEPVHAIPSFKPSQYASELAKKLEAQVKAKEEKEVKSQVPLDIWTKLEMDLKARDKIVIDRARQAQKENGSQSSSSSSSPSSQH